MFRAVLAILRHLVVEPSSIQSSAADYHMTINFLHSHLDLFHRFCCSLITFANSQQFSELFNTYYYVRGLLANPPTIKPLLAVIVQVLLDLVAAKRRPLFPVIH